MTILPQLEQDLYKAAQQRLSAPDDSAQATDSPDQAGSRRAPRRWFRTGAITWPWVGAAVVVLVIVLVGGFALGLRHGHAPKPAGVRHYLHFRAPRGENIYPLGAVATKAQLLVNFAVLRRPQDARDRSWRPNCDCGGAARQLYGLTRYARSLPGDKRVFLDVEQFIAPGQLNMAAGSYVLNFNLVSPHGNTNSAAFGPNTGYLVSPVPDQGPDNTRGIPPINDWVSVIPDGVATVRWTFACARGGHTPCAAGAPRTYTVAVIHNVAARSIPASGNCQGCLQPMRVQWLSDRGNVVASFGQVGGNLPAPPFVKGGRGARQLTVLHAKGIAAAQLGQSSATAITTLDSLLGPAAQSNVSTGDCGIDHESVWTSPAVSEPLTIYQRHGRFVGYQSGAPAFEIGLQTGPGAILHTSRGLIVGDTIGRARRLYGRTVTTHVSRGTGSWRVSTDGSAIGGTVLPIRYPLRSINARNPIVTIQAGDTGCHTIPLK